MQLRDEDEMAQLAGLTELCEYLSISTEDNLAAFPTEQVVPLLVRRHHWWQECRTFGGAGLRCWQHLLMLPLTPHPSAFTPSSPHCCQVNFLGYEHNPDLMLLAARALTFLADVFPPAAASIIRHGAVPAFCARLLTIEYIDLAEQSLQVCKPSVLEVFVGGLGVLAGAGGAAPAATIRCCCSFAPSHSLPLLSLHAPLATTGPGEAEPRPPGQPAAPRRAGGSALLRRLLPGGCRRLLGASWVLLGTLGASWVPRCVSVWCVVWRCCPAATASR